MREHNGFVSNYWYDAAGERTVKTSGDGEGVFVNSVFSGGRTGTANFTAYVNPYLVVSPGGNYTKHIYVGSQRIVSKLGDLNSYGADPRRIEYAGAQVDGSTIDYKVKYTTSIQNIKDRYAALNVPYNGKDNNDYVNGLGFCCATAATAPGGIQKVSAANDNPEKLQYYYHSDHLGSSSLITDLDGNVAQHIEYVPFGEVFIEEKNSTWNTPYKFNGKELDEETGLYYYGARYMDPRTSVWISVDPLAEKYPGVSSYVYCFGNPINLIDPDGCQPIAKNKIISTLNNISKLKTFAKAWKNSGHGNESVEEWGFTVTMSNDKRSYIGRNLHTDQLDGHVNWNSNIPITEQLKGFVHTHPYDKSDGAPLGVGFSPGDMSNLLQNASKGGFFTMVEAGSKRYAAVISDPKLATKFFNKNKAVDISKKMENIRTDPKNSSLTFQEQIDKALIGTFGDGSKSGVSIFVAEDKNKENFKPLKQ